MRIRKIACIQLDGEFPDLCSRLVMPDYGLPLIGTILSQNGCNVRVYVERVEPLKWEQISGVDLVCLSTWNAGADKAYHLAREIKARLGIPTIMGGVHATYFPTSCLENCDYVVLGEGDETILELVEALGKGKDLDRVPGIAYRRGEKVHYTAPRGEPSRFDTIPDYSLIEGYRRFGPLDVLFRRRKLWLTVQSSRGCPFHCRFCIVNTMFPHGYRTRDIESVVRDLRDKRQFGREMIFVDNEFGADRSFAKKLLRRIIEEELGLRIVVFARVEATEDDELLMLMREAGVANIYQGYESIQPETLVGLNKRQDLKQIVAAIEKLHSLGLGILGSFALGADTDSLETIEKTVDFVLEKKLTNAYFWPLAGFFPEKKHGYQTLIPWYRTIFPGWRYYDGHFVSHFPLKMSPSKFQRALIKANRTIYSSAQIIDALKQGRYADAKGKLFLKYQWKTIERIVLEYIPFLEDLERGLYDPNGNLRQDLLVERVRKNPKWTFQAGNRAMASLGVPPPDLPPASFL